jgi:hypothetical protein
MPSRIRPAEPAPTATEPIAAPITEPNHLMNEHHDKSR